MRSFILPAAFILMIGSGCQSAPAETTVRSQQLAAAAPSTAPAAAATPVTADPSKPVNAAAVMARKQVPILCYHQIRDWRPTDSKTARDYIIPVQAFKDQMKMLADSGYHTISPDQLYNYLTTGAALPSKPIMLTFDDTDGPQYTIAKPEMEKYGFRGMFFIMTVSLDRPHYMSRQEVKALSDAGHYIGSHTWDHHNVKLYKGNDWVTQIEKPTKTLEAITGKPIRYFAYPFGLWSHEVIAPLKERGFIAAFQLGTKRDEQEPLYTIRRIIVPGWPAKVLDKSIKASFKG